MNREQIWRLEDGTELIRVHSFSYQEAFTYGNMTPPNTDIEKRERIRMEADRANFPRNVLKPRWWAFRIFIEKGGTRQFDIENVPKLIIDAFCKKQIERDKSRLKHLHLYDDDTIDEVRLIQVMGLRSQDATESTNVEIFGCYQ